MSTKDFDFDPRADRYYQGLDPLDPQRVERAINDGWTFVEEWSYEQDAHGYCHSRTDLIALLLEIKHLRSLLAEAHAEVDELLGPGRVWIEADS